MGKQQILDRMVADIALPEFNVALISSSIQFSVVIAIPNYLNPATLSGIISYLYCVKMS
jgi:hypothetical protein